LGLVLILRLDLHQVWLAVTPSWVAAADQLIVQKVTA
jgi:hypothetical protein